MKNRKRIPAWDRFTRFVSPEPNSGCWIWEGCLGESGYGYFSPEKGKNTRAHRFSYEHEKGKIPDNLILDHICRMRCCVNPDHLEPVSHQENRRRGIILYGTDNPSGKKTHCKQGHPFSVENTSVVHENGGFVRKCKKCRSERARLRYIRKKMG
jgi:hypothetical protein